MGLGLVVAWHRGALIANSWTLEYGLSKRWPFIWWRFTRDE